MAVLCLRGAAYLLTFCLCFVAVIQGDVDLHYRHVLNLNSQAKRGLKKDVKGGGAEYVDVTFVVTRKVERDYLVNTLFIYVFVYV